MGGVEYAVDDGMGGDVVPEDGVVSTAGSGGDSGLDEEVSLAMSGGIVGTVLGEGGASAGEDPSWVIRGEIASSVVIESCTGCVGGTGRGVVIRLGVPRSSFVVCSS